MHDDAAARPVRGNRSVARKVKVQVLIARRRLVRTRAWRASSGTLLRAKDATSAFWNWKHRPAALGSAAIILGILAVIFSVSALLQGPTAAEPPNAAEWLSAISTFWGAVAAALGAALTGGALLIAALTYQRQIRDRHAELEDKRREEEKKRREQAEAVTVTINPYKPIAVNMQRQRERLNILARNDGKLAVYGVTLVAIDKDGKETKQRFFNSILPDAPRGFLHEADSVGGAYTTFTDTAGARWKRWHNGELKEIPEYPKPDE